MTIRKVLDLGQPSSVWQVKGSLLLRTVLSVLALAGCSAAVGEADLAAVREGQERACAAVVAEHVGLPVGQVAPAWQAAGADGLDVVAVRHGGTVHTCEVDAGLRVRALRHPDAEA